MLYHTASLIMCASCSAVERSNLGGARSRVRHCTKMWSLTYVIHWTVLPVFVMIYVTQSLRAEITAIRAKELQEQQARWQKAKEVVVEEALERV